MVPSGLGRACLQWCSFLERPSERRAMTSPEARPLLFTIAYRMLGSVIDAEDVLQEALLQWQRRASAEMEIESPRAVLSTIVVHQSINQLNSARLPREMYPAHGCPSRSWLRSTPIAHRARQHIQSRRLR